MGGNHASHAAGIAKTRGKRHAHTGNRASKWLSTDNFCTKNHNHVQTYSLSSINEATIPTEKDLIKALLCPKWSA